MSGDERRRGRAGSIEALLDAAEELFAERGPGSVSLRDVARRARVNHGLIHHYIGSRDDLLRLVFARATERARAEIADAADPGDAIDRLRTLGGDDDRYTRLLAWALLEGHDPRDFHGRSAALDAAAAVADHDDPQLRVLLTMSMVQTLGWKLFGEYARIAAGLDTDDPATIRREIDAIMLRLISERAAPSVTQ